MKTFGQVIMEARKKAGLTQKEVAERLRREDGRRVLPPLLNDLDSFLLQIMRLPKAAQRLGSLPNSSQTVDAAIASAARSLALTRHFSR